jgi:solute:Na+ symporter, SSS family
MQTGVKVSALDGSIIAVYLVTMLALGLSASRLRSSTGEFFLGSHRAGWRRLGLSLFASNLSPSSLIGITGAAYAVGVSVYNYEWLAAVILALYALYFLPAILVAGVYTFPEFLERRFNATVRIWFAALTLLLNVLVDASGVLYVGAVVLGQMLPGLTLTESAWLLATVSALAAVGGLRAVMYTEAVQAVVILSSAVILALFALRSVGGWPTIAHDLPRSALSLIQPARDPFMPWTGLIFGAPILGFYYWGTNQLMVQRMLSARSVAEGQRGAIFAGFLKLLVLFVVVMPGLAGRILYPHLQHHDTIYVRLAFGLLPSGLLGLLLAAFMGALMAQLSATYNSAASLIAMDFARTLRPQLAEAVLVKWGRVAAAGCMVASIICAPQISRFPSLWQYLQTVLAYTTPPAVALFLGGMLSKRVDSRGAMAAIVAGNAVGAALFATEMLGYSHIQFLNVAGIVFAVAAIALMVASRAPRTDAAEVEAGSFHARLRTGPAMKLDLEGGAQYWAAGLLAVTCLIVFYFR